MSERKKRMKTILKWLTTVILAVFLIFPATAYAGTSQAGDITASSGQTTQVFSHSNPEQGNMQQTIFFRGSSYHTGSRTSSSRVSGSSHYGTSGYNSYSGSRLGSGFGSHLFSFGAGWFFGSMFHPFGGSYGYGYHSFSLIGLLFDVLIIWVIWRIIRRIFR